MTYLRTNTSALISYNALQLHSRRSIEAVNQLSTGKRTASTNVSSVTYLQDAKASRALRSAQVGTRNVMSAISLVQAVDSAAKNIQKTLINMKTVATSETATLKDLHAGDKGRVCDYLQQAEESIINMVEGFSWNGTNFLEGGGQNDHTTTLLNFTLNAGGGVDDNFTMGFKSFHPHSAIDRTPAYGIYGNAADPNLPNLNKTAGTDTHAYGDAAMYVGNPNVFREGHLHADTNGAVNHTLIQLTRAIDGVTAERARLGGYINRLNYIADNNIERTFNAKNTRSKIMDTDYAYQAAELSKSQILRQSATAVLAQVNHRGTGMLALLH